MALIVRIDVDRPYGRQPVCRHVLSRFASDFYFPKVNAFGYLQELTTLLDFLQNRGVLAYVFFRRCTLPGPALLKRMLGDGHEIGLHLENSRTFHTFVAEKDYLERHIGQPVLALSKHGSGGRRFGWHHHAPYEPEKYIAWASQSGMRLFFGNLEDPTLSPYKQGHDLTVFPSAFWLEPEWRDTEAFPVEWLLAEAQSRDIALLLHPENVLASPTLMTDLDGLLSAVETRAFVNQESAS